jgi:DNA polymerase-3 subunit alpha
VPTYASFHNHTDYSNLKLIDSINTVHGLIDYAYELGLAAVAITDHDSLSGHVKAIQHYKNNYVDSNFKLILGNEIYVTKEDMSQKTYEKGDRFFHMILIARNKDGHKQLRELSSLAWDRMFVRNMMRTPTFISDLENVIGKEQGNIIGSTACLGGVPGFAFLNMPEQEAVEYIDDFLTRMNRIFGEGNFFVELQPSHMQDQIDFNKFMLKHFWGKYPFWFATDTHYLKKEDRELHAAFLNSKDGEREAALFYSSTYMMDLEEIYDYMSYISPEQLEEMRINTLKVADSCEFYDLASEQVVPKVPTHLTDAMVIKAQPIIEYIKKQEETAFPYLKKYLRSEEESDLFFIVRVLNGFAKLIGEPTTEYLDRLEYEAEQLWEVSQTIEQPISNYFNTMAKMIDIIWEDGDSLVGISRGSAAGFLVNYCLGITQLDPLRQPLEMPAWRFMHKDRPELPDIDIDCEGDKRTKVFNKVREYFQSIGGDVINVCTFGTEKSKSALRTAARGLGVDDDTVSYIVSLIPNERGADWTLSQCYYGDEEHNSINAFVEEIDKEPKLWEVATRIEGLITRLGIHAAGVIALNNRLVEHNSLMKTSKGVPVSAFNLEDSEYLGGLKYDFLTINALDKIRTTLNLLLEDNQIEWQGNLRDTYNKYLLPINLEYEDQTMWSLAADGKIVELFQFDTPVGAQAIKSIRPSNIAEMSIANSVMRLMKQPEATEMPADTYVKYKNNIYAWYEELDKYLLTKDEVDIIKPYLAPLSGVADSQESVMMMVMDPQIANFTVTEANALRKAIAKKKRDVLDKVKDLFFSKGEESGTSSNLLNYLWDVQIGRQIGYSFSTLHTLGYSTIALQEMNLAYRFPTIYWNTACLSVNAGGFEDEDYTHLLDDDIIEVIDAEDKRSGSKMQYGKIASAISKFSEYTDIELPDINEAGFGFKPNVKKNSIMFGLKGVARIGKELLYDIIERRPYKSLADFVGKMESGGRKLISKDRVVNLIKAGAFDKIEKKSRTEIMQNFLRKTADLKTKLTSSNINMLIEAELFPESLGLEQRIFKFNKYISKDKINGTYFVLDEIAMEFYEEVNLDINAVKQIEHEGRRLDVIKQKEWKETYKLYFEPLKEYVSTNHDELLDLLNSHAYENEYNKYASGNELRWELDALNFYHSGHELKGLKIGDLKLANVHELRDNAVKGYWVFGGKTIPEYELSHIVGTVLDSDKVRHVITFSTPSGVINVKLYNRQFSLYDRVIFSNDEEDKVIEEDSFLSKGTFLLITGIKRGDVFIPKVYKKDNLKPIYKINLLEDGNYELLEKH